MGPRKSGAKSVEARQDFGCRSLALSALFDLGAFRAARRLRGTANILLLATSARTDTRKTEATFHMGRQFTRRRQQFAGP